MTLQDLFSTLKGSRYSGNFGHTGNPPNIGGSGRGGGHVRIGIDSREEIPKKLEEYRKNRTKKKPVEEPKKPEVKKEPETKEEGLSKDTDFFNKEWLLKNKLHDEETKLVSEWLGIDQDAAKALIGKSYSFKDEETGYTAGLEDGSIYKDSPTSIKVTGNIWDKDGKSIGEFERTINKDKTVSHDLFRMNEETQGSGFGSKFYKNAEDTYKQAGIKQVKMYANLEVGGYAWGRMGFDFASESTSISVIDKFRAEYKNRYGKPAVYSVIPQTAYEMAAWTGPDGHRLGKDAMLGSSWGGKKNLSDSDPGYQVGQEYYKSKGKKK